MYNCLNQIITPTNPCANSTPCKQFTNAACVQFNGTLTCGSFGNNPTLDVILGGFCTAFLNINTAINTINSEITSLQGCPCIQTVKINFTGAQIDSAYSTPLQLVPAPPTGYFIQVLSVSVKFVFGISDTTYTGDYLNIGYTNGDTQTWVASKDILVTHGTNIGQFQPNLIVGATLVNAQPLVFFLDTANASGTDGNMTFYLTYLILPV